ncbi:MAG: hypothetical protein LBF15_05570 [Candidatus Peribacteria bacterium]|jgi:DNA mismatch repair ATPase MutS|nr:hypothetical protein [Candidatus Peribacteria bacterium]
MLRLLEEEHNEVFGNQLSLVSLVNVPVSQVENKKEENEIEKALKELDINNITPIGALQELVALKSKLKN